MRLHQETADERTQLLCSKRYAMQCESRPTRMSTGWTAPVFCLHTFHIEKLGPQERSTFLHKESVYNLSSIKRGAVFRTPARPTFLQLTDTDLVKRATHAIIKTPQVDPQHMFDLHIWVPLFKLPNSTFPWWNGVISPSPVGNLYLLPNKTHGGGHSCVPRPG